MKTPSLRWVLPLALLITFLTTGGMSYWLTMQQKQKDLTEFMRQQLLADVARLVRLQDAASGANSSLLAAEMAQIASRPQVRTVLLVGSQGEVIMAHRSAWKGRLLAEVAPTLSAERIRQVVSGRLPDWQLHPGEMQMDAMQAFDMPSMNTELRSSRRGLAYVAYDVSEQRQATRRREALTRLPNLAGLIVIFLLMGWWLEHHVARPLARLDKAADALKAGDWSVSIPRGGFPEIDQLGAGLDALRQELSATWQAMPDLLFELDGGGRCLRVVAARPELRVDAPQSLVGRNVHEMLPAPAARVVQQALDDARAQGAVWGRELSMAGTHGTRWFEISVARKNIAGDASPTFLLISRDVTERKVNAEALRTLNESLELRVQERTQELLSAKNEAEKANQGKSEFLSRMSHELRTPLNAILGFGQLLQASLRDPRKRQQSAHIVEAGQHLLALINEVLDLSRVEAGQMSVSMAPVSLQGLMSECLSLIQPLADAKGVNVHVPVAETATEWVHADCTRLKQVLINLLSNGVKYNRPNGWLRVQLEARGHRVRISIQDSGMGLSQAQLTRLFIPFERLGAEALQIEGTGIGLALSQRLMALMGGEIGVTSTPGEGSTFWVELPQAVTA